MKKSVGYQKENDIDRIIWKDGCRKGLYSK